MIAIFPARQSRGFSVEAQREAVRRYLVSHHGEQIAEFVQVEKRSDRLQLAAAMARQRGARPHCWWPSSIGSPRSVAFIATLMDSKGFDLAVADMPGRTG